jgi:regulatory protein
VRRGARRADDEPPTVPIHDRALRRLSRRDHSEQDLRTALLRAGYEADAVEAEIARLRDRGLLNDHTYAARLTRTKIAHSGVGSMRVRGSLRQHGVANATADAAISEVLADVSEQDALDHAAKRYWPRTAKHEPRDRLRRAFAHLMRRGFPAPLIVARLRVLFPKGTDALDGLDETEDAVEPSED